ncbi:hypothetical protein R3X44_24320, partial [Salmonella enterica subsp. enterica serovar Kentucky]
PRNDRGFAINVIPLGNQQRQAPSQKPSPAATLVDHGRATVGTNHFVHFVYWRPEIESFRFSTRETTVVSRLT